MNDDELQGIWQEEAASAADTREDKEAFVLAVSTATADGHWCNRKERKSRKATLAYAQRISMSPDAVYQVKNSLPANINAEMAALVEFITPGALELCAGKSRRVSSLEFDRLRDVIAANLIKKRRLPEEASTTDLADGRMLQAMAQVLTLACLSGAPVGRVTWASSVCAVLFGGWLMSPERAALA